MVKMIITVSILTILIPCLGLAEELPERPWGQVYQEDIKKLKGAHKTSAGFYIDGVQVSGQAYLLYDELTKIRRGVHELREELRESNQALIDNLLGEESTSDMGGELIEIRQALHDLSEAMMELSRALTEKQGIEQKLDYAQSDLRQIRRDIEELRRIMIQSNSDSGVGQTRTDRSE
jgi:DNA repair exonuclease SbcCD ATPase subunit